MVSTERLGHHGDIPEEIPAPCTPFTENQGVTLGLKRRCLDGGTFPLLPQLLHSPFLSMTPPQRIPCVYLGQDKLCQPEVQWDAAPDSNCPGLGWNQLGPSFPISYTRWLSCWFVLFFFPISVLSPDEIGSTENRCIYHRALRKCNSGAQGPVLNALQLNAERKGMGLCSHGKWEGAGIGVCLPHIQGVLFFNFPPPLNSNGMWECILKHFKKPNKFKLGGIHMLSFIFIWSVYEKIKPCKKRPGTSKRFRNIFSHRSPLL